MNSFLSDIYYIYNIDVFEAKLEGNSHFWEHGLNEGRLDVNNILSLNIDSFKKQIVNVFTNKQLNNLNNIVECLGDIDEIKFIPIHKGSRYFGFIFIWNFRLKRNKIKLLANILNGKVNLSEKFKLKEMILIQDERNDINFHILISDRTFIFFNLGLPHKLVKITG